MRERASAARTREARVVDTLSQTMAYCDAMSQTATPISPSAVEREATLELPGGRTMSYATFGAEGDPLVVVLDGPGSRGLARACAPIAAELRLRLAAPDRPGW